MRYSRRPCDVSKKRDDIIACRPLIQHRAVSLCANSLVPLRGLARCSLKVRGQLSFQFEELFALEEGIPLGINQLPCRLLQFSNCVVEKEVHSTKRHERY